MGVFVVVAPSMGGSAGRLFAAQVFFQGYRALGNSYQPLVVRQRSLPVSLSSIAMSPLL
jgi:hypothetical protein